MNRMPCAWFGYAIVLLAVPCAAQSTPKVELSVGYNAFKPYPQPGGWYGEVTRTVRPAVGLVGLATGNYTAEHAPEFHFASQLHTLRLFTPHQVNAVRFTVGAIIPLGR